MSTVRRGEMTRSLRVVQLFCGDHERLALVVVRHAGSKNRVNKPSDSYVGTDQWPLIRHGTKLTNCQAGAGPATVFMTPF